MIHTRTKIIAAIAFSLLIGAIVGYGFFFSVVANHKTQLREERQRVAEAEAEEAALSALETTLARSKAEREELRKFILEDDEIIELLSLIEKTAKDQRVTLSTDSLTVTPLDEIFESLQLSLTLEGSFNDVMHMIQIIETLPKQSNISGVNLTTFVDDTGITTWQGSLNLTVIKFAKT